MQQLSLFEEDHSTRPGGEALREGGEVHQAASASKRTEPMMSELMEQAE
jgi:hypothetical protein